MAVTPDEGAVRGMGPDEAAALRLLRRLVTALTAVMIAGILSVVVLLVIRLQEARAEAPALPTTLPPALHPVLPDAIALPEGARPLAVTRGAGWFAVVTGDERILIYGADGALRQEVRIEALHP